MIDKYLPYLVTFICAIISAVVSIFVSRRGTKSSYKNLIEEYGLKSRQYVSQVKFDAEFEIIKSLAEKLGVMVGKTQILFPAVEAVEYSEEGRKDNYSQAIEASTTARNEWLKSAPFISESLAEKVDKLISNDNLLLSEFYLLNYSPLLKDQGARVAASEKKTECTLQVKNLYADYQTLVKELREYVNNLYSQKEITEDAD